MRDLEREGYGLGAPVRRSEDDRLMRGRGSFVSDLIFPGLQEVAFLRSPLAHAEIRGIAKPEGKAASVFLRDDLRDVKAICSHTKSSAFKVSDQHPLAHGKVRFVGEPIAMCVAESRAAAEDIAEEIDLDLRELPPLVDAGSSLSATATRVHEHWSDNIVLETMADTGIDKAKQAAAVIVRRDYTLARQAMNPLEGKAVLAHWDYRADQLVVYTSTQVPHMIRAAIASHLALDLERVRVIAPDVGGGFGYKCVLQPEELCVAWLALTYKRPFRWTEDRREHLVAGANCREHRYSITAYADPAGKLLGIDADIVVDAGAYSVWPFTSALEGMMAGGHLPGPYKFESYRVRTRSVATNKPPITPYRGVARTGICFAMELTIDAIARAVGREPWEVRLENLVSAVDMPYVNPTGKVYDSGSYGDGLQLAVREIGLGEVRERQARAAEGRERIGIGFANYIEMTGHGTAMFAAIGLPFVPGYEQANVRFTPDGGLIVSVGVQSHGQGMETSIAQIAHEVLGIEFRRIRVLHGDTGLTPFSTGTYASRSITMAGGAVARACRVLVERLRIIAGHLLQCAPEAVEIVGDRMKGPSGDISLAELARTWYVHPERLPANVATTGLEVTEGFRPKVDTGQYSYGTHAAVVAVNVEDGTVRIVDYVVVEDCGTIVNPLIVEGQTYGGAAQGIGTALFEEMPFDENGQPLASTLADYLIPGAPELPNIRLFHLESPSPNTEFGIKGVGEGGAIPPPAAIFNAVNDALHPLGVELNATPLTPRKLLAAIAVANHGADPGA